MVFDRLSSTLFCDHVDHVRACACPRARLVRIGVQEKILGTGAGGGSAAQQMKKLSGSAFDRKAAPGSRRLTSEERALLRRMVELVVRRLHLYEVGEATNDRITLDRV